MSAGTGYKISMPGRSIKLAVMESLIKTKISFPHLMGNLQVFLWQVYELR